MTYDQWSYDHMTRRRKIFLTYFSNTVNFNNFPISRPLVSYNLKKKIYKFKMKVNLLLFFLTILSVVALADFGHAFVSFAPRCGNECTINCGGCTCTASNCNDNPYCTIAHCDGPCDQCNVQCGTCKFSCTQCVGTPPICVRCIRV